MNINDDPHHVRYEPEPLADYKVHAQQAAAAFGKVEGARTYAVDETSERAGVALARATWRTLRASRANDDGQLTAVLRRVAPRALSSVQSWRQRLAAERAAKLAAAPR